jgi:hypothetical protein
MPYRPQGRIAQDRVVAPAPIAAVVAETFASTVRIVGRKPYDLIVCGAIDDKLECISVGKSGDEMTRIVFASVIGAENRDQAPTGFPIDLGLAADLFRVTGPTRIRLWRFRKSTALDSSVSARLNPDERAAYFCKRARTPGDEGTRFVGSI